MGATYDKPLKEWSVAQLRIETSKLLNKVSYLIMTYDQKLEQGLPASEAEMRLFIQTKLKEIEDANNPPSSDS